MQNHSRTPKTCFTLGLECFGHIYSYQNSFEIDVISKKLHALKGKLVDGRVDLDVDWKGDFKKSLIQGVIKPRRITVTIPQRFSQSIPSLQIIKPEDQKIICHFLDVAVKQDQLKQLVIMHE